MCLEDSSEKAQVNHPTLKITNHYVADNLLLQFLVENTYIMMVFILPRFEVLMSMGRSISTAKYP